MPLDGASSSDAARHDVAIMASQKLRKYLAFYRKRLNEEPENIEARLRLAALFRQMGRPAYAVEEYSAAAKLLASEGLPLEAIAACKAILELDPSHQQTQRFLARLYARVPEATDDSVRIARPVESGPSAGASASSGSSRRATESPAAPVRGANRNNGDEVTRVQSPSDQSALRNAAAHDGDRQEFELDVFDIDSLELDDETTERYGDLEALEAMDDPEEFASGATSLESTKVMAKREFRVSELPEIPLFSQLPRRAFVDVLDAMELVECVEGSEIIRPDDPASCLYIVRQGSVRVEKDLIDGRTVELDTMGDGEVFGEFRLLAGMGGQARVVADTDVELMAVRDEAIVQLGERHPQIWEELWSFYFERMLNHSLASSPIFASLSIEERNLVAEHFELREFDAGQVLFERGDAVDTVWLVVDGSVGVGVPDGDGDTRIVDTLEAGSFAGVSPCALQQAATATCRARTDVVVYSMEGEIFRELMYGIPEVAEAVRQLVETRQSRTPSLAGSRAVSERV